MSFKKNIIPISLAVIIHLALLGLLLWNFSFKDKNTKRQFVDTPVQAKLVTAPTRSKKDASSLKRRQEQARKKEQEKQRLEKEKAQQQEIDRKKLADEQKLKDEAALKQKQADAEKQKLADAEKKKIAAEKKKAADVKKKAEEAERKKTADAKRKKEEAARKKREAEAKKRKELEDQMASLEDELFEADKGDVRQSQLLNEVDKIKAAIHAKIVRNWDIPQHNGDCVIIISTGPGGVVLGTETLGGDDSYCASGETAISRADPLPYSDDPFVIEQLRTIRFTFDPSKKDEK